MKFKFCSDGDCPLWALAALHATSTLPAQDFRKMVECVTDGQNDDAIMDILKESNLSSRDECARAAAVVRWTLKQTWRSKCAGAQLTRDLLVMGVPRAHATVLAEAADTGRADYERNVEENGLLINGVSDVSVEDGPEGSIDAIKLTFFTDDSFTGDRSKSELLIDKPQARLLLEELKTAYKKMEELENE